MRGRQWNKRRDTKTERHKRTAELLMMIHTRASCRPAAVAPRKSKTVCSPMTASTQQTTCFYTPPAANLPNPSPCPVAKTGESRRKSECMMRRHLHFSSDHAKACRPFAMRCLGSCRLWTPRRRQIPPPSTDFSIILLLGDDNMPFMLPLGKNMDLRQYLASHMRNHDRYPKRAPSQTCAPCGLAHCADRPSQAAFIINTLLLGRERALQHMHAKHRCRNAAG